MIITELAPLEKRKVAYALSRMATNLGTSIGPAAAGVLAGLWFPAIFLVDGATSLLAALILVRSPLHRHRRVDAPRAATSAPDGASRSVLWDLRFVVFLLGTTLIHACYSPATFACTAEHAQAGRTGEYLGWTTTALGLGLVLGPWVGMAVMDRFGPEALWTGVLAIGLAAAVLLGRLRLRSAPLTEGQRV